MNFHVNIQNFGKLENEKFVIDHFTVLAGRNNSGKSFVSKILYSVLKALRANHAAAYLSEQFDKVEVDLTMLVLRDSIGDDSIEESIINEFEAITALIESCPSGNLDRVNSIISEIGERIDKFVAKVVQIRSRWEAKGRKNYKLISRFEEFTISLKGTSIYSTLMIQPETG